MKKRLMFLMSVLFVLTFGVSIKQPAMVCYAQEDDSDYDEDDDEEDELYEEGDEIVTNMYTKYFRGMKARRVEQLHFVKQVKKQ